MWKPGCTTAHPADEELAIAQSVVTLADFGCDRDLAELRHFIKSIFEKQERIFLAIAEN